MRVPAAVRSVPRFVIALVALAPVGALVHAWAPEALERVAQEDGPVEYGQAIAYFVAAGLFLARFVRRRGRDGWSLLLALGLFAVGGEEISWGQRLFGISTPEGLETKNVQGEFNFHNIEGIHQNVRALGIIVIVGLFIVVPLARMALPWFRSLERSLRVPLVPLWAAPLAIVALAYMVVTRLVVGVVFELDEVGELYVALTALAFGAAAWREQATAAPVENEDGAVVELTPAARLA